MWWFPAKGEVTSNQRCQFRRFFSDCRKFLPVSDESGS